MKTTFEQMLKNNPSLASCIKKCPPDKRIDVMAEKPFTHLDNPILPLIRRNGRVTLN